MPSTFRNLVELVELRAFELPTKFAFTYLVDGERTEENLTYGGLAGRARAIAATLQAQEKPGARVVLLYPPGLDYISAFLGCLFGGFVAVPAYPPDPSRLNRTLPRLQAIVNDAGADIVLTTSAILGMTEVLATFAPDLGKKRWLATDVPSLAPPSAWRPPIVTPETLAFLQYTSGSTGMPKGVMLTHENLLANERMIQDVFKLSSESVGVGWLPLYHDMGLIGNVLQTLYSGFRCVLMSPLDFLHRPLRWLEAISRYGGTASGGPNFSYDLCVRKISEEQRQHLDLRSWKLAFSGAEPVRPETMDLFARTFEDCGFERRAFLPCYGLAEASLLVSGKAMGAEYKVARLEARALEEGNAVVSDAGSEDRVLVSTGRAVAGSIVLVVDPITSWPRADGEIGEVWVSGPHVAIGYWNDAEKSARTFGARLHPTAARGFGDRTFLRTGDLGFFRDGELYISGRLKDLIIIRGRNYYPQDVERVVEDAYPTLRRGCSAAFSVDVNGEEKLIVAVEVDRRVRTAERRSDGPPSSGGEGRRAISDRRNAEPAGPGPVDRTVFRPDDVFDAIRRNIAQGFSLHAHAIVLLKAGSIPKTSSGKIQRHACRAGYLDHTLDVVGEHVDSEVLISDAPVSLEQVHSVRPSDRLRVVEDFVRTELARVLRVTPASVDLAAPLNGLGLDSLMAVELNHAVERNLDVVLPVTSFLREGNGHDLARKIMTLLLEAPLPAPRSTRPSLPSSEDAFGLSSGQEALWFLHQLAPESSAYNISTALRLRGDLSADAFELTLRRLLERHPALTTTYADEGGRPRQTPNPSAARSFRIERIDASHADAEALDKFLERAAATPFDLVNGPVFRATVLTRGRGEHIVVLAAHHIAADLWSIVVLLSELQLVYPVIRGGSDATPPLPASAGYRAFVEWQRAYLEGEGNADWAYWKRQIEDAPSLDLPTDKPRPPVQSYRGASHRLAIDADVLAAIGELSRREGVTVYVILLAAFQLLLGRYSGQSAFLVGSPVAGRPRAVFDRTVGYFVNPLPLRADLGGSPTARDFMHRVREAVLDALEHQNFPFAVSVQRSAGGRDPSRSPVFQAMFVLEKAYLEQESDVTTLVLGASEGAAEFAGMELRACPLPHRAAQFDLTLNLAQSRGAMRGTLEYNTDLFAAATIERLSSHFQALLRSLVEEQSTPIDRLAMADSTEIARVTESWNDTAVQYPRGSTVVDSFDAQVKRRPDARAVTFEGRSVSYRELDALSNRIAVTLQKRGIGAEHRVAVFMERSVEMVASLVGIIKAGAAYVPIDPTYPRDRVAFMTSDSRASALVTQRHLRAAVPRESPYIIEADGTLDQVPAVWTRAKPSPLSAAYVIYTSGSTGKPKGAINTHGGLANRLRWMQQALLLKDSESVLQKTSFSFDVSVWEFFWPLIVGARIVVARPDGHKDCAYLVELVREQNVSILHFVPSMLFPFLSERRVTQCASIRAVVCSGEALSFELAQQFHGRLSARLHNLYGPTEAAIDVSWFESRATDTGPMVPIGKPIANTKLYVLDANMTPVPVGVSGQLYIGGVQLARGYWNRASLTAERFVPNPFAPGERLYATGDRAKWRADGNIEYLGRLDHQVKVRGFRIELGEIESGLRQHAGVRDAVVVAREYGAGGVRLVGYVAVDPEAGVTVKTLRAALERSLPEYMIPSAFVLMPALPLTPNGKLDRKALPTPEDGVTSDYVAPVTEAQKSMCRLAAELLRVPRVGIYDNFFELGGHSLLATQFVSRVRDSLHVGLTVRTLFENPTVAQLSDALFDPASEEGEI